MSGLFSLLPSLLPRPVPGACASPACFRPLPLQRGAHLLPARGALRSHIIMHIRYKQSCLIILRHISDRVINKHCKINEEKCDLQFPLIGKALAVPRHKVIALGLRRGEGQGQGQGLLGRQCLSASHTQLCPGHSLEKASRSPGCWASRSPSLGPGTEECRSVGCPRDPCLAPSLL